MGYKKHNWLDYNRNLRGTLIEVTIRDELSGKSDFFRCANNKEFKKILMILKEKYGYGFNDEDFKKIKEREKNWINKDREW